MPVAKNDVSMEFKMKSEVINKTTYQVGGIASQQNQQLPEYFVSDCGVVWECISGCENLSSHDRTVIRNALSDLCGTDITEITIYY